MSTGSPSLTILSDDQKFNGENFLQWKSNMTQILGAKGLLGYVDGNIPKPSPPTTSTPAVPAATPIYSTTPTLDEWLFRDQLARGHIALNCSDTGSLGVKTTGTAKEAWDSIVNEWGKSTDMRISHAQEALNRTEYVEGTDCYDFYTTSYFSPFLSLLPPVAERSWHSIAQYGAAMHSLLTHAQSAYLCTARTARLPTRSLLVQYIRTLWTLTFSS